MKYHAHGLNIQSEIRFKEFQTISENSPCDVEIIRGEVNIPKDCDYDGLNCKVSQDIIFLFYDGIGIFKIEDGSKITVDVDSEVSEGLLRIFLLGSVMGALLYQRGGHILHSSCVNINGGAFVFLGDSGSGKSTLAMSLYNEGYPVVGDDYISISFTNGIPFVTPGAPYLKLSKETIDAYDVELEDVLTRDDDVQRCLVRTDRDFSWEKIELKGIFHIKTDESARIINSEPNEALRSLLANSYTIKILNDEDKISNLEKNSDLINKIPIYNLYIPRSLDFMGEVAKIIEKKV